MLAFLVCFLLASVPLSGAVFSSNALMQPLEEISSIPSEGYALVRDGSSDYLYLDGAVVKTVTREGGQEVTREGGSESIRTFSDGRLVSEQRPDGTVLQYDYSENGTLRRIEYIADGETVRMVQYNWSPVSGLDAVIDITNDDAVFYSSGSLSLRDGGEVKVLSPSLMASELALSRPGSVQPDENGMRTVTVNQDDGYLTSVYDPQLRLVSESFSSAGAEEWRRDYVYDETGELAEERFREGGSLTVTAGSTVTRYTEGEIDSVTAVMDDGTYLRTRYRDSRPWAEIHYDTDRVRVLGVRML